MGKMQVTGTRQLVAALNKLPKKTKQKVLRGAVRKGARIFQKEVKARAPVGPIPAAARKGKRRTYGKLKDQIRVFRRRRGGSPTQEVFVVDVGKAFWGAFLEYERGTSRQPPRPFFRRAIGSKTTEAVNVIRTQLTKGVIREAKKLAGPIGSTLKRRRRR